MNSWNDVNTTNKNGHYTQLHGRYVFVLDDWSKERRDRVSNKLSNTKKSESTKTKMRESQRVAQRLRREKERSQSEDDRNFITLQSRLNFEDNRT
jgi:hypothetical protein